MIEHLKSGLSISTHIGCSMGCSYCVLSSLNDFENGPVKKVEPQIIVDALLSGQELFVNGETPLLLNNRTDPLHPLVEADTYGLLDCLIRSGLTSPVLLISKFPPTDQFQFYYNHLPLMFIYSYSGVTTDFNYPLLREHLAKIRDNVPQESRLHYLRPIIPRQNDDIARILDLLSLFAQYGFSGSIMTGLRITSQNRALVETGTSYDPQHKLLQEGLYPRLLELMGKSGFSYPVYRHTSCAVASFMHRKCKLDYYQHKAHCNPNCINFHICDREVPTAREWMAREFTMRFGEDFRGQFASDKCLVVESPITQEQVAFLKNAFGISVKANQIILSPSERSILGYE